MIQPIKDYLYTAIIMGIMIIAVLVLSGCATYQCLETDPPCPTPEGVTVNSVWSCPDAQGQQWVCSPVGINGHVCNDVDCTPKTQD